MSRLTPFEDLATPGTPADGGGNANPASRQPQSGRLLGNLHRAVRGKYLLVIPLMLIFGAAGAAGGWKILKPIYKSEGTLQLQYELSKPLQEHTSYVEAMAMYDEVLQTQCAIITSRRVVDLALNSPEWQTTRRGSDAVAVEKFVKELLVLHPPRTQTIEVIFGDHDPIIAATGTRAIVRSYEKYYNAIEDQRGNDQMVALVAQQSDLSRQLIDVRQERAMIGKDYGGTNLAAVFQQKLTANAALKERLDRAKFALTLADNNNDAGTKIDRLTPAQIAVFDPQMQRMLAERTASERVLQQLLVPYGDRHPKVVETRMTLAAQTDDIERYSKQYRDLQRNRAQSGAPDGDGTTGIAGYFSTSKDALKAELAAVQASYDASTREQNALASTINELKAREEKIAQIMSDKEKVERQLSLFKIERKLGGRLNIISYGEVPITPAKDRRIPMAIGLGAAGMLVPLLLITTFSGSGRRYRYSDETDRVRGLPPLLGILPTLPEPLSDPEMAAVAAHCVHQLRIMLQVSGDTPGGDAPQRKIYMITSPSSGDGKTSLTMALGLSFAASGSRTLVIDCDMAGKGLSHLLNARQSPGLVEALGSGTLTGRVKKTTTRNLYILPIGDANAAHAGSLSPTGIRRVLAEARKVFDAVVIDTGPVLGSLEAQSVAAVADGVILTIARGQLQSLVEKSVRLLRSAGANICGIVFNRAQDRDFHRAVSRSSSHASVSTAPTPTRKLLTPDADSSRFGPLARSVASFLPTGEAAAAPIPARKVVKPEVSQDTSFAEPALKGDRDSRGA